MVPEALRPDLGLLIRIGEAMELLVDPECVPFSKNLTLLTHWRRIAALHRRFCFLILHRYRSHTFSHTIHAVYHISLSSIASRTFYSHNLHQSHRFPSSLLFRSITHGRMSQFDHISRCVGVGCLKRKACALHQKFVWSHFCIFDLHTRL